MPIVPNSEKLSYITQKWAKQKLLLDQNKANLAENQWKLVSWKEIMKRMDLDIINFIVVSTIDSKYFR